MTRLVGAAMLFAAIPCVAQQPRIVRVIADRAAVHIIGREVDRVHTAARVTEDGPITTITATVAGDIVVPRNLQIDVRAGSGAITIEQVAAVSVTKPSGTLEIHDVTGSVSIDMSSGEAVVERAGRVTAVTATANLTVRNIAGAVVVTSINGRTTVGCVSGPVTVSDTNGVIDVRATRGNVSIDTTSGRATWSGMPLPGRQYTLKTLAGVVKLSGRGARNASIVLSTHVGRITTDVPLQIRDRDEHGRARRVSGTFGPASAVINLDAFEGNVILEWKDLTENDEECSQRTTAAVGDHHDAVNGGRHSE